MKSWRSSIHYFRRSLIDAERLSPSDDLVLPALGFGDGNQAGDTFHPLDFGDLRDGRVDPQLAKELLARLAPPGRAALTSTEVGLLPRVDHLRAVDGAYPTHKRRVLVPLMVFAMMDAEGRLSPSDKPPWIPREWLGAKPKHVGSHWGPGDRGRVYGASSIHRSTILAGSSRLLCRSARVCQW